MHASSAAAGDGTIPEPDELRILPTRDPPPGRAGDPAELPLLLVQERDPIARALTDVVIHRIFSAGLALETALGCSTATAGPRARSGKPSASWTWRSGTSGTSYSITISPIRPPAARRARAFRARSGGRRCLLCRVPARWRPGPGGGRERPQRGPAGTVPSRRPPGERPPGPGPRPGHRAAAGIPRPATAGRNAPGGDQPDVGIQGREQSAARPGGLPSQREHGGLTPGHHVQDLHLDQHGHARPRAQRTDPGHAGQAITVGSVLHAGQQPGPSQIRQPGHRGRKAQLRQCLGRYEHVLIRADKTNTLPGTKIPPHSHHAYRLHPTWPGDTSAPFLKGSGIELPPACMRAEVWVASPNPH